MTQSPDATDEKPEETPRQGLEGSVPDLADPAARDAAMDQAFDYRGDVTLQIRDGRTIEGYVFDRRQEQGRHVVRILLTDSDQRLTIAYEDITRLVFSGKDTAAGKSWETWVKKYAQKKALGEKASIEPEKLD